MMNFDAIVIGAGVIGASVARSLALNHKLKKIALVEKENQPALHSSGRNSGVLHSGFNLKPRSLKARFCVEGNARIRDYAARKNIPCPPVGTLVVALDEHDRGVLQELLRRGRENNVPGVRIITREELIRKEPNAAGLEALYSPTGCLLDGKALVTALLQDFIDQGGEIFYHSKIRRIEKRGGKFVVKTSRGPVSSSLLINCGGLYADRIAHSMGVGADYQIIPFKGAYFKVRPDRNGLVRSMLYPAPDLTYPFLGVHWTATLDGGAKAGPSAALAFGREAYMLSRVSLYDVGEMVLSPHFRRLWLNKKFRSLVWKQMAVSISKKAFASEARKLVPSVKDDDFLGAQGGIRAQLVHREGRLVEDLVVEKKDGALHVLNVVSPGLTASLPFGDFIAETAVES